jgi:hypothetical protein
MWCFEQGRNPSVIPVRRRSRLAPCFQIPSGSFDCLPIVKNPSMTVEKSNVTVVLCHRWWIGALADHTAYRMPLLSYYVCFRDATRTFCGCAADCHDKFMVARSGYCTSNIRALVCRALRLRVERSEIFRAKVPDSPSGVIQGGPGNA